MSRKKRINPILAPCDNALLVLAACALCLLGSKWCYGQTAPPTERQTPSSAQGDKPRLRLTTTVKGQSFCDTGSMRLNLRLRYDNLGEKATILFKNSSVVFGYMISHTLKAASVRQYETNRLSYAVVYGKRLNETAEPSEQFVIIQPGQSHETDTVLYLVNQRTDDGSSDVTAGEHFLQIKVRTWVDSPDLAQTLKSRWAPFGDLWTQPVTSEPMRFFVRNNPPLVECS